MVISDTAGRAWRNGQTDIAIGCAGLVPLDPFAGRQDTYGNPLVVTAPAVADEVAAAAELASGKLGRRPVVIVRGLPARLVTDEDGPGAASLVRPEKDDMFGLGSREAVVAAVSGDEHRTARLPRVGRERARPARARRRARRRHGDARRHRVPDRGGRIRSWSRPGSCVNAFSRWPARTGWSSRSM